MIEELIDVEVFDERKNDSERFKGKSLTIEEATKETDRQIALKGIAKMISSGEIPHDIYIKCLSGTYLGFMTEEEIIKSLK